jgi:hypothetical protein
VLCELVGATSFYLGFAQHEARSFRLLALTLSDPRPMVADAHAAKLAAPLGRLLVSIGALFDQAVAAEALAAGNTLERTVVLWTALHGVTLAHKLDRIARDGTFAADRLAAELARALLVGWGAAPNAVAAAQRWLHEHPVRWEQLS